MGKVLAVLEKKKISPGSYSFHFINLEIPNKQGWKCQFYFTRALFMILKQMLYVQNWLTSTDLILWSVFEERFPYNLCLLHTSFSNSKDLKKFIRYLQNLAPPCTNLPTILSISHQHWYQYFGIDTADTNSKLVSNWYYEYVIGSAPHATFFWRWAIKREKAVSEISKGNLSWPWIPQLYRIMFLHSLLLKPQSKWKPQGA